MPSKDHDGTNDERSISGRMGMLLGDTLVLKV